MITVLVKQMFYYFIFAGFATLVNIGSRYYLSTSLSANFTLAVVVAYTLGMLVNYLLNKYLNFPQGPRSSISEMRTFLIIALIGLVITTGLSNLLALLLKIWLGESLPLTQIENVAHVSAVGLTAIYSFFGHKYFTYREGIRSVLGKRFSQTGS